MKTNSTLNICLAVGLVISVTAGDSLAQAPVRKYSTVERLQEPRLAAVQADRFRYQGARRQIKVVRGLQDFRAILHVHAEDAAHTGGTRPELLVACKNTGVNVVLLTNHVRPPVDYINDSWRGLRDGVLFIPGAEFEGFLCYPTKSVMSRKTNSRDELINMIREDGGGIFLSHIEERPEWPTERLTGMEIYNHHADFKPELDFIRWLQATLGDPDRTEAFKVLLEKYPSEIFGAQQDYLADYISKWDADSQVHRVTGVAANDCHHNQVITVKVGGPDSLEMWMTGDKEPSFNITTKRAPRIPELTRGKNKGDVIARIDLDPYERSLRYVTTHILAANLVEKDVRSALEQAHAYVAHDWLCDPTGFAYVATNGSRQLGIMGDEIRFSRGLSLQIEAPVGGHIRVFRNGIVFKEADGETLKVALSEPGTYRAEVWLEVGGELRPWIYANPIRVLP